MPDSIFNRYFSYVNIYTTCKSFHEDGSSCKNITVCITYTDQTIHTFIEQNLFKLHFGNNTLCNQIQYQSTENEAICRWTFLLVIICILLNVLYLDCIFYCLGYLYMIHSEFFQTHPRSEVYKATSSFFCIN